MAVKKTLRLTPKKKVVKAKEAEKPKSKPKPFIEDLIKYVMSCG
jgi:hypothetical protein